MHGKISEVFVLSNPLDNACISINSRKTFRRIRSIRKKISIDKPRVFNHIPATAPASSAILAFVMDGQ